MPAARARFTGSQRSLGIDCLDSSFNTRPPQSSFFSGNRGDGSFDYDCSGVEERQSITEATACICATTLCNATTTATSTPTAACGTQTSNDSCSGSCATCALDQAATTSTKCR